MSDPKDEQREPDELELEAETIKDLDVDDNGAEGIAGGHSTISTLGHDGLLTRST